MKSKDIENRTVGLNVKPLEPRSNKRLYQYGALFVAIIMVFSSIGYATIKLGEDGSGQKWFGDDSGLITNSNGKAWSATGANLQLAIWDLNSTGGTVDVGADITLSSSLRLYTDTAVDFHNHKVTLTAGISFINATDEIAANNLGLFNCVIKNVLIILPADYTTGSVIYLYLNEIWDKIRYNTFENIYIQNEDYYPSNHNYTAIHLDVSGHGSFYGNVFRDIHIWNCGKGIFIENNNDSGWANGNTFENIGIDNFNQGLRIEKGVNTFRSIILGASSYSKTAFNITGGDSNNFASCFCWDWHLADNPYYIWYLNSSNNYIETTNIWEDKITNYQSDSTYDDNVYDNGTGNHWKEQPKSATAIVAANNTREKWRYHWVCDGIADQDTLTDALKYLYANRYGLANGIGGRLILMEGDYWLNESFVNSYHTQGFVMQGQGNSTKLHLTADVTRGVVYIDHDNVVLRDMYIDAEGYDTIGVIRMAGVENVKIFNCDITGGGTGDSGIVMYRSWMKDICIENCRIYNNSQHGIELLSENVTVSNCYIFGNGATGIIHGNNCTIINNRICDNSGDGIGCMDNSIITGNSIFGNTGDGIDLDVSSTNNVVANNNICGNGGEQIRIGTDFNYVYGNLGYMTTFQTINATSYEAGFSWFNTTSNVLNVYNGTAWVSTTLT